MKYLEFVKDNFDSPGFPVFRMSDLKTALGLKGIKPGYLRRMVNYLLHKRRIIRITKGTYTFHDDISVVGFAFTPFYYGLENALTIRKLWDQNTNPAVITWRNIRTGQRRFGDGNYSVHRISKRLFFGYELIRYYDFWLPVSDCEKTLIDLVYFGHDIDEEVLAVLRKAIDRAKLDEYLKSYGAVTRKAVYSQLHGVQK
jgi:predicted transcriptional regulator of viral defense system